jgi:periplasmic protein CpxP/Spy
MSVRRKTFRTRFLLGGAVLALPLLVSAAPPLPPYANGSGACDMGFHGEPPRPPMGPGFGRFGDDHEEDRPPPFLMDAFLMDVKLSEEQQDKVFAIMHAAAPALREQSKAAHKARDALHELSRSAQFNEGAAATLAQTQGTAESQLALLHTRLEHEVYSLLTPEQQTQVVNRRHEMESHRGEGPPRH